MNKNNKKTWKLLSSIILLALVVIIGIFRGDDVSSLVQNLFGISANSDATPSLSPTAEPSAPAAPTSVSDPTKAPEPIASPDPTATLAPTATTKPTVTVAPTATTKPTVTAAPTAATKPTATVKPTATPKPTKAPTVTPAAQVQKGKAYYSKNDVAEYLHLYKELPINFITKKEAEDLGWKSNKGNLWDVTDHKCIGGDYFGNYEGLLPKAKNRKWYECDVNYNGGFRGTDRILYSNDGLIYFTNDHYETFTQLY